MSDPFPELTDAVNRMMNGDPVICVLCQNSTGCVCPPFGHPAYFVLTDFRHGKITADDPEFRKYFRLSSEGEPCE